MSFRDSRKSVVVGNFCLGAVLGKGASGTVYEGLGIENGDFVAVKQVNLQSLPNMQLNSIMQEIDLMRDLKHPNIVKYVQYENTKDYLYIVLEYVENGSLANIVKKFGRFPESLVCVYITQVLNGLVYLHEQGVVHRDIKGANILTTKEGVIKLADFGVATKLVDKNESTSFAGSPYWVAPEIIEMNGASAASDIWSVGCTVIELLTGSPPYFEMNTMSALYHIVQDDYPPLPPDISAPLKDWLMECFQKDPMRRITAKKLLKHKWIKFARLKDGEVLADTSSAEKSIQDYNQKLKTKPALTVYAPSPLKQQRGPLALSSELERPGRQSPSSQLSNIDSGGTFGRSGRQSPSSQSSASSNDEAAADEDWDAEFNLEPRKSDDLQSLLSLKGLLSDLHVTSTEIGDLDFDFENSSKSDLTPRELLRTQTNRLIVKEASVDDMQMGTAPAASLTKWAETGESDDDWGNPSSIAGSLKDNNKENHTSDLALKLKQKFTNNKGAQASTSAPASPVMEASPSDADIFEEFESDIDEDEIFNDENVAKDNMSKMSDAIVKLMERLRPDQDVDVILSICKELISVFRENPGIKTRLIRKHGVIPIMEMLEVSNAKVIHSILQVVNQIVDDNVEIRKNLCFVGGIPVIMKFAGSEYPSEIRLECAYFILLMCSASTQTLQMVIACRGLPVIVDFLSTPYKESRDLVWMSIDAISRVFQIQSTPRNDFCRLFAKCGLLKSLAMALKYTSGDDDADGYPEKIADVFLHFSAADEVVKLAMSHFDVLSVLFGTIYSLHSAVLVKILKCVKQLAEDHKTRENILQAGAIRRLIGVLGVRNGKYVTFMHHHILGTLQQLCRLNRQTLYQAVEEGIIPHLQYIIQNSSSALKEKALPLICELAYIKNARPQLWRHECAEFYLNLLKEIYWQANALDSLAAWLADEPQRVEEVISKPHHIEKIVAAFKMAQNDLFSALMAPLASLVHTSTMITKALATTPVFVQELVIRLDQASQANPQVKVYLLRILGRLFEHHPEPKKFVLENKLYATVKVLSKDKAVMVRTMAKKLSGLFKKIGSARSLLSLHQRKPSNSGRYK